MFGSGDLREAQILYERMSDQVAVVEDRASARMIMLYGERGLFDKAKKLFLSLRQTDTPASLYLHNAMINACVRCKQLEEAVCVFEKMEVAGVKFDGVTVSILLNAFTKAGVCCQ